MKINAFAILLSILLWAAHSKAQIKIGFTNPDAILSALPEAKTIEAELKTYQNQLANELQNKQKEFQTKLEAYQKNVNDLAPAIRESRERELQNLSQALQDFQEKAQADMQMKQAQLLQPVYEKIQKAIDELAKAENFDYIFVSDAGQMPIILFAKEEYDITNKIIAKLGGTPIKKEDTKK
ncbi:MAG: OmpH family outer membrane protein [Cytophagales bacterium]|nr:OmpH family outer membrane protein [Bernardetiaceae bacterium]MDW8211788.1 OmpH family outer membrane protein [Cytophagales bacterium]